MSIDVVRIANWPKYSITRDGMVCCHLYSPPRELKKTLDAANGYLYLSLYDAPRRKKASLHSLLLESFKGPRPLDFHGAHLNGDKLDNRLENLEWVSPKENTGHRYLHGTILWGDANPQARLTEEKASIIRDKFAQRKNRNWGATVLAKQFGVSRDTIFKAARGERWGFSLKPS